MHPKLQVATSHSSFSIECSYSLESLLVSVPNSTYGYYIFRSPIASLSASSSYPTHICLEEPFVVPYQWVISGSKGIISSIEYEEINARARKETHLFHNFNTTSQPFIFTQILPMPRLQFPHHHSRTTFLPRRV